MNTDLLLQFAVYGLLLGGTYGLLAIPLGVMHATTGTVDAAVGAYAVLAAVIAGTIGTWAGAMVGVAAAVGASLITAVVYQAIKSRLGADPMPFVLTTFGIMMIVQGVIQTRFGTDPVRLTGLEGSTVLGFLRLNHQSLLNFAIGVALALGLAWLLYKSPLGLSLRAGADRPSAASLSGIRLVRLQVGVFVAEGLLAGIAGVLYVQTIGVSYSTILTLTLAALGGAVLCGLRGPVWAFLGGLTFGVLQGVSAGLGHGGLTVILPYFLALVVVSLNKGVSDVERV